MRRFRFPKRNSKYFDRETPLQRILRFLIIIVLFGAVVYGFWLNNERRTEMLRPSAPTRMSGAARLPAASSFPPASVAGPSAERGGRIVYGS